MNEQETNRARTLGSLIHQAREHARRSLEECAGALGVTAEQLAAAEAGEHVVSLPELEALAIYLDVPMAHFWGSHQLRRPEEPDYRVLLALRHKIVGGLLRQSRMESGLQVEALAEAVELPVEELLAYESGHQAVPYLLLEKLARQLGKPVDYFLDDARGPLGRHEAANERERRFQELPPEVQSFVIKPANINYLETAMHLSEMDVDKLRTLAASILEITY